jgi:hypothetical protein
MKSLFVNWDRSIESAYIIALKGNTTSEYFVEKCIKSCEKVGMPYKIWYGYNGSNYEEIEAPDHLKNDSYMNMIKLSHTYCTRSEIATTLSHISLWKHCAEIDRPIVILEHDAIMTKKFTNHDAVNSIIYLGCKEWYEKRLEILPNIPTYGSDGPNYMFVFRAHAYSIDPIVARHMCAYILNYGISLSADITIRADIFNITHRGLYAYDENEGKTTILNRPENGRFVDRNDFLKY